MRAMIVGENQATASRLRQGLARLGRTCASEAPRPLEFEGDAGDADMVFLLLPEDLEHSWQHVERLRARVECRIVAVGPAEDPQRILAAIHAGADDYLDETQAGGAALEDVLGRCRGRCRRRAGQLVAVASPAAGASVMACNVACAIAARNAPCGLLDFAPTWGDQAALFNLRPRHTLSDVAANIAKLDRDMFRQSLAEHDSGVCLLAAAEGLRDRESLDGGDLRRILQIARDAFETTVVDVGHAVSPSGVGVVKSSQHVLLVFQLTFTSVRRVERLLEHWSVAGVERDRLVLVPNACGRPGELPLRRVRQILGREIAITVPDDPAHVAESANSGIPVVQLAPRSGFSASIRRLAELVERREPAANATAEAGDEPCSTWRRLGLGRIRRLAASLLGMA